MVPVQLDIWQELRKGEQTLESYILYDPFDVPEYAFLQWRSVERALMESVIGAKFDDADFLARGYGTARRCLPSAVSGHLGSNVLNTNEVVIMTESSSFQAKGCRSSARGRPDARKRRGVHRK